MGSDHTQTIKRRRHGSKGDEDLDERKQKMQFWSRHGCDFGFSNNFLSDDRQ